MTSLTDRLQVDVLEGGREHADAVDLLALGNEAGDDRGHVVARGALEQTDAGRRLHLDTACARQIRWRSLGDESPPRDDRHAVADQLDLAQQVRVEQDGVAARPQLLEQYTDHAPARRVERTRRLV